MASTDFLFSSFPPNIFSELLNTDLPVVVGVYQTEQRRSLLLASLDSHEFQYLPINEYEYFGRINILPEATRLLTNIQCDLCQTYQTFSWSRINPSPPPAPDIV